MLGPVYFELVQAVHKAKSFEEIVSLLGEKVPVIVDADEAIILEVTVDGLSAVHGSGRRAEQVRDHIAFANEHRAGYPEALREMWEGRGDLNFAISDHISVKDYQDLPYIKKIHGSDAPSDSLYGMLFPCASRFAYLSCSRSEGVFSPEQRERFDAVVMALRGVFGRLASDGFQNQVRARAMATDAQLVLFIVRKDGEVIPLNHAAVRRSESWWPEDEAAFQLDASKHEEIKKQMAESWDNPIHSHWSHVELDLGGGLLPFELLATCEGEGLLMLGNPSTGAELLDLLSNRQREIMHWIAEGKSSAEVGIILGISHRTVEKHLEAVFRRFGVENRIAAVRRYLEMTGKTLV